MTDKTTPITIATVFKQRIVDMPDTIETKKDIETYSKNLVKEILNDFKKKNKKENVDLPKKPLNPYQQFVKDMQRKIKDENPELDAKERFSKIAQEWQKQKVA